MHIRRYKCEADEGWVLAVFDRTFPFSHSFLESPELAGARQHLVLSLGQSETLIAEIEGSLIGFITVGRAGYISALYVARAHASRGVGSALLQAAQDRYRHFRLHVFSENVSVVQFYKAREFAIVDEDTQIDSSGYRHRRFEMERANAPIA